MTTKGPVGSQCHFVMKTIPFDYVMNDMVLRGVLDVFDFKLFQETGGDLS